MLKRNWVCAMHCARTILLLFSIVIICFLLITLCAGAPFIICEYWPRFRTIHSTSSQVFNCAWLLWWNLITFVKIRNSHFLCCDPVKNEFCTSYSEENCKWISKFLIFVILLAWRETHQQESTTSNIPAIK